MLEIFEYIKDDTDADTGFDTHTDTETYFTEGMVFTHYHLNTFQVLEFINRYRYSYKYKYCYRYQAFLII